MLKRRTDGEQEGGETVEEAKHDKLPLGERLHLGRNVRREVVLVGGDNLRQDGVDEGRELGDEDRSAENT